MGFVGPLSADENTKRSKAEIIAVLASARDHFGGWLDTLSDDFLSQPVAMMPGTPPKSRFEMLLGVKEHEMHHRGQLMLTGADGRRGAAPHPPDAGEDGSDATKPAGRGIVTEPPPSSSTTLMNSTASMGLVM